MEQPTSSLHTLSSTSQKLRSLDDAVTLDVIAQSSCPAPSCPPPKQQQQQRLAYIDWLRAVVIALVVAFHCIDLFFDYTYSAGVYLGIVNTLPADPTRQVAILLAQLCQSWFMGLLFLLSGYFSKPSYDRKGPLRFLGDRVLRLVLPLLAYDLLIQPLAFEMARHSTAAPAGLQAASNGFSYYYSSQFLRLGHGASWFLAVLFVFDMVYAAVRVCAHGCTAAAAAIVARRRHGAAHSSKSSSGADCTAVVTTVDKPATTLASELPVVAPLQQQQQQRRLLSFSAGATAVGVLAVWVVMAGLCLVVRLGVLFPLSLPQSMWVLHGIQFQPAYLPQYVTAFVLGLAASSAPDGLARLPSGAGSVTATVAAALAVWGAVIMSMCKGSNFGKELQADHSVKYVAVFTVWEQLYATTMWVAMLVSFRVGLNKQGGKAGAAVTSAAYAVYVVHIPVVTTFGVAFAGVAWHAAAKCALVTPLVVLASWMIGMLLKQLPGVKHVL